MEPEGRLKEDPLLDDAFLPSSWMTFVAQQLATDAHALDRS